MSENKMNDTRMPMQHELTAMLHALNCLDSYDMEALGMTIGEIQILEDGITAAESLSGSMWNEFE